MLHKIFAFLLSCRVAVYVWGEVESESFVGVTKIAAIGGIDGSTIRIGQCTKQAEMILRLHSPCLRMIAFPVELW